MPDAPASREGEPTQAELLAELTRVKALFQLRAVVTAMGLRPERITERKDERWA